MNQCFLKTRFMKRLKARSGSFLLRSRPNRKPNKYRIWPYIPYLFRQINSPLGVVLQSCWMIWFGGRDGTGIGLTGAVCAGGTYKGGFWLNCGGGDCGTVKWGGGGNTYPWPKAAVAAHNIIDAIAIRIESLLFGTNCNPAQHCTRNWMEQIP